MNSAHCQCSDKIADAILSEAQSLDACAAGFAKIEPVDSVNRSLYTRWIEEGRQAGMQYLEKYSDVRDNPALLLDGAQSMLCLAFAYRNSSTPRHPLFADYALGEDYHDVLRKHLAPLAEKMQATVEGSKTRICIDTAPLRERYWAARAGLGFIGRNNHLIIPGIGSRVFLAEILWTAPVVPSKSLSGTKCCRCGKCVQACPYGALGEDGSIDCRRCLSYLTIEHRGDLPAGTHLPERIYGCDICQDVCPHNIGTSDAHVLEEFKASDALMKLTLPRIAGMTPDDFRTIFRRSAVRRAKLEGLLRNARLIKTENDNRKTSSAKVK